MKDSQNSKGSFPQTSLVDTSLGISQRGFLTVGLGTVGGEWHQNFQWMHGGVWVGTGQWQLGEASAALAMQFLQGEGPEQGRKERVAR